VAGNFDEMIVFDLSVLRISPGCRNFTPSSLVGDV